MDERKDRLKRFLDQDIVPKMHNLKRIRAFNGKGIRNYKHDRRISLRTRFNIYRNYRRSNHEIATLGAVGASMSHIGIWKRFLETGAPLCLVLEDDARITEEDFQKAAGLWSTLPSSWGAWILGYYEPNLVVEPIDASWNRVYNFTAAHAYLLKRETAAKLLEDALPVEMHVDHYMAVSATMKGFDILQHPSINIPFWGVEEGPRIKDSNTSQHKRRGCKTCKIPDDMGQLYREYSKRSSKGITVKGPTNGQQSNMIRTFHNTRKMRRIA